MKQMMRCALIVMLLGSVFAYSGCVRTTDNTQPPSMTGVTVTGNISQPLDDDTIIWFVLNDLRSYQKLVVLNPHTAILDDRDCNVIQNGLRRHGYNLNDLVGLLCQLNESRSELTISSPSYYVVDRDGIMDRYFGESAGGDIWEQWRNFKVDYAGVVSISLPAYDSESGVFLIYKSFSWGPTAGHGDVYAYRFEHGKLILLAYVNLWIS